MLTTRLRRAGGLLLALIMMATSAVAGPEEDPLKIFASGMKKAGPRERVTMIRKLSESGVDGASRAISRYLTTRDRDVRIAAIQAEGRLADRRLLGKVLALAKREDDPETKAALFRALGAFGSPRALKLLKSAGRKWLPRDSAVASAAAEALGRIPSREAVEILIRMLEQTDPRLPSSSDKEISSETRRTLYRSRPAVVAALRNQTGWDFPDGEAWQRFWKTEQKRWKPRVGVLDLSTVTVWRDPGYGFSIRRPSDEWSIDRSEKRRGFRVYLQHRGDAGRDAVVWVHAFRDRNGLTSEIQAENRIEYHTQRMRDIQSDSLVHVNAKVAGRRGHSLSFTGLDSSGAAVHVEERYVVREGMMFVVASWRRTGLSQDVEDQVHRALNSFSLYD
jgi:HEAT repeats/PBS lyase HEAT-like repeat